MTYRDVSPHFGNLINRRLKLAMIEIIIKLQFEAWNFHFICFENFWVVVAGGGGCNRDHNLSLLSKSLD